MPKKKQKRFDLLALRQIPILEVAGWLSMNLVKTGSGIHCMKGDGTNNITSLTIFEQNNRWKRFSGATNGGCSSGSTIDLVMHIKECDFTEATEFLSSKI